jgi:hypothetical protein
VLGAYLQDRARDEQGWGECKQLEPLCVRDRNAADTLQEQELARQSHLVLPSHVFALEHNLPDHQHPASQHCEQEPLAPAAPGVRL